METEWSYLFSRLWQEKVRVCSKCTTEQPLANFHKDKRVKIGRVSWCKSCVSKKHKLHYEKNREEILEKNALWYKNNKEKHHALVENWYARNPHIRRERNMKRRAAKRQAVPLWVDKQLTQDMYKEADYLGLQVDHIVPLMSDKVCGLHWEGNMQLLSQTENASKGNRYWPNM